MTPGAESEFAGRARGGERQREWSPHDSDGAGTAANLPEIDLRKAELPGATTRFSHKSSCSADEE